MKFLTSFFSLVCLVTVSTLVRAADLPPTVRFVTPAAGAVLTAPGELVLEVDVVDDFRVTQVTFFNGILQVGELMTVPPYRTTISNLGAGDYSFRVVAVDTGGNRTESEIAVKVVAPVIHPEFVGRERLPGGQFFMNIKGVPARTHVIEWSAEFIIWFPIHTNTPSTSTFSFVDSTAVGKPRRFYRVSYR